MVRPRTRSQSQPDINWKIAGTGDFNLDGQTDIVWHHATTGQNAVWYMTGSTYVSTGTIQTVADTNWEIVGTGFFNADTSIDLLWRNRVYAGTVVWFMSNTTQVGSTYITEPNSISWKVGGIGDSRHDSDGDGLPDLWERINFGNLTQAGGGDWDADGVSNFKEYQNGTSPTAQWGLQVYTPLKP